MKAARVHIPPPLKTVTTVTTVTPLFFFSFSPPSSIFVKKSPTHLHPPRLISLRRLSGLFSANLRRIDNKSPKNLHKREILLIFALSLQELRGKDENMKQENNRIQLPLEEIKLAFAASCVEGAARKLGVPYIEIYERMRKVDLINKFILPHYDTLHTESREYLIEDVIECLTNWEKKASHQ